MNLQPVYFVNLGHDLDILGVTETKRDGAGVTTSSQSESNKLTVEDTIWSQAYKAHSDECRRLGQPISQTTFEEFKTSLKQNPEFMELFQITKEKYECIEYREEQRNKSVAAPIAAMLALLVVSCALFFVSQECMLLSSLAFTSGFAYKLSANYHDKPEGITKTEFMCDNPVLISGLVISAVVFIAESQLLRSCGVMSDFSLALTVASPIIALFAACCGRNDMRDAISKLATTAKGKVVDAIEGFSQFNLNNALKFNDFANGLKVTDATTR